MHRQEFESKEKTFWNFAGICRCIYSVPSTGVILSSGEDFSA
jgi:hypothetical protein